MLPMSRATSFLTLHGARKSGSWIRLLTNGRRYSNAPAAWPSSCDVLVVGGGAVGSSSAYHLKQRAGGDLSVVVLEEDSTYKRASTVLSLGNIRQQFSVPENTQLSMFGLQFLRQAPQLLAVEGHDPPNVHFIPRGYLFVATQEGLQQMEENYRMQTSLGAELAWLWPRELKGWYPWLNVGDNIVAGVVGTNNEGSFDPWGLLMGLRRKAESLGARYLPGRLTGLHHNHQEGRGSHHAAHPPTRSLTSATVRTASGEEREITFSTLVVAAGGWSGAVGRMAGLGSGEGALATPLPVEPRKRYVFCVHAPEGPWDACPIYNDHTGMYFRADYSNRQHFMCGMSPKEEDEPGIEDLEVDYDFFYDIIWPLMVERSRAFENLKVKSAWAGYYDVNLLDHNLIIGFHPVYTNMCLATGLSGHGIQQSPAVGRAVMEFVLDGRSHSINLDRFSFDRILAGQPLMEKLVM